MSNDVTGELEKLANQSLEETKHHLAEEKFTGEDPLQNAEFIEAQLEHELSQCMRLAKTRIKDGFTYCARAVDDLARTDTTIDLDALKENVNRAFSRFDTVARAKDMCTLLMQGISWKELLGLDDRTMELLYRGAKYLFDLGHHPEAEAAFFFLTTIDYSQYAFWLGLGHAAFHLNNLNQALNAYEMAEECKPGSIWPNIYMANCFEAQHDYEESLIYLKAAQDQLHASDQKDEMLAQELLTRIQAANFHK